MKRSDTSSPVAGKGMVGLGVKMGLIWPAKPDILGRGVVQAAGWKQEKGVLYRSSRRPKGLKTP